MDVIVYQACDCEIGNLRSFQKSDSVRYFESRALSDSELVQV